MEIEKLIDSPRKDFDKFNDDFKLKSSELFESLSKDSKVDIGANKQTCAEFYKAKSRVDKYKKSQANSKVAMVLIIVLCVILSLVSLGLIGMNSGWPRILGAILLVLSIVGLILYCWHDQKAKKERDASLAKYTELADKYEKEATEQRRPLWSMIYPNRADERIRKVIPLIHIDPDFEINRYAYRVHKFGFPMAEGDRDASVLFSKSGRINGNPFLILREKYHHDERKRYVGTRTVRVRRSYTDSKGHRHYTTSSELLTAVHREKAPFYDESQVLVYGNEAAPDLTFSRQPVLKKADDASIKKIIKTNSKILEKESIKQRNDDDPTTNFQRMSNDEFESLFFAKNRNNEVQFRLRFTPLAQINRIDLIKNSPYGDDFVFRKSHRINYIITGHSLQYAVDFYCSGDYIFDYEVLKKQFLETREGYFKSFYFQLAPLLCVPIYQQHKPFEYIYGREFGFNNSPYSHEAMSNRIPGYFLSPEGASTDRILKSSYLRSVGRFDILSIESLSYHANPQVIEIPKTASDGSVHLVPVHYFTYSKVSKKTQVAMRKTAYRNKELKDRLDEDEIKERIRSIDTPNSLLYNKDEIIFCLSKNSNSDSALAKLSELLGKKEEKPNE